GPRRHRAARWPAAAGHGAPRQHGGRFHRLVRHVRAKRDRRVQGAGRDLERDRDRGVAAALQRRSAGGDDQRGAGPARYERSGRVRSLSPRALLLRQTRRSQSAPRARLLPAGGAEGFEFRPRLRRRGKRLRAAAALREHSRRLGDAARDGGDQSRRAARQHAGRSVRVPGDAVPVGLAMGRRRARLPARARARPELVERASMVRRAAASSGAGRRSARSAGARDDARSAVTGNVRVVRARARRGASAGFGGRRCAPRRGTGLDPPRVAVHARHRGARGRPRPGGTGRSASRVARRYLVGADDRAVGVRVCQDWQHRASRAAGARARVGDRPDERRRSGRGARVHRARRQFPRPRPARARRRGTRRLLLERVARRVILRPAARRRALRGDRVACRTRPSAARALSAAQRRATRIVRWVMRPFVSLIPRARAVALVALATVAADCARPVLYYPTPESAGAHSAPRAASRPEPSAPTEAGAPAAPHDESAAADMEYLEERHLLVPVAGADMSKVDDSFYEDRDGGERTHHALDILAPRGTPILSADDGKILRMSNSSLGGICMYPVDPESRIVYYYAHMDHYNDAMTPGRTIVKGDTLGYVGTTGNAPKDTP